VTEDVQNGAEDGEPRCSKVMMGQEQEHWAASGRRVKYCGMARTVPHGPPALQTYLYTRNPATSPTDRHTLAESKQYGRVVVTTKGSI